jgi:type I restriction enzyme S subunit
MAENTPDIRFSSFAEDWKCSKIGDVITEKKRPVVLDDNTTYQLITVKRRNEGVVSRGFLKGRQILVKNYFELKAKDYVISKRQVVHGANGIVPEKLAGAIVSNEYLVAIANDDITAEFLTLISKLPDMYKKFFVSSYGIDIEKLVFDVDDWKKRELSIPDTDEQKKMTVFFKDFDDLCSAEQQKYDKLVNLKKSMLYKMFPKDGENIPKIRFDGFGDEWETRKISDMGEVITGSTPSTQEQAYYSRDGIPWVTPTDITKNITTHSAKYLSEYGQKVARIVPQNAILVTCIASIGKNTMLGTKGSFNQQINCLIPNEKEYAPYFLLTQSELWSKKMKRSAAAATMQIVNKTEFSEILSLTPSLKEQTEIGNYFAKVDKLIALQHQKLQKLTNIKKAFLEKMFL